MTKKNSLKKALITSALSMVLCSSMLVGTTYAWFTDSVTSTGNVIQTGRLDISLEHADTVLDADAAGWTDASEGPIFSYDNWEPGYTAVKYVKIENKGSLDLKFVLNIRPNKAAEEVNLADVIEVYMLDEAVEVQRDTLTTDNVAYVGTLTSLMNETDGAAHGALYADATKGNVYEIYTIVLKMSESAGNEYQNKSVGGGFSVELLATQLASESDSLGSDDKDDTGTNKVKTAAEFVNALTNLKSGETVTLMNDIELVDDVNIVLQDWTVTGTTTDVDGTTVINTVEYANNVYNIDLNNHTLSATTPDVIELHGGTLNIKNGTISMNSETEDGTFIFVGGHSPVYGKHKVAKCGQDAYNPTSVLNLENVTFKGRSAVDDKTDTSSSGHIIAVTCHAQVHIRNCTFDLLRENGEYPIPFDVYSLASDGIGNGTGDATRVYVYEGTKFYGDPTYLTWQKMPNTDWVVNGGWLADIAEGYKLEAAPIADGDTYAWYTVVAE